MTQTRDLIKKMADFFTGEEFYEKGEDARLELSPDDVRCMNDLIKQIGSKRLKEQQPCEDVMGCEGCIYEETGNNSTYPCSHCTRCFTDKYKVESEEV